ncbi:TIGR02587 family membrane protein [Peteryoungia desertarenae]|uniref:TIGR02587 family membrane protein n=1 Tax=Peteryoungia desertarenae TaxID=1813451 RepID=A0ABX6QQR2_9HYPH|nr:TIGR02587 family membrane protein [Peteryoungia desertarenae]QLF70829.1 TIGR02587 family membrane protein [Peteryoungia desertarenae]
MEDWGLRPTEKIDRTDFLKGLARAMAGALIFALPMLMTMEMWQIGASISRFKLLNLLLVSLPLLALLSHRMGFEETHDWGQSLRDTIIAMALAILTSALLLAALGVLKTDMSVDEWAGKIAIQAVPASIGALLGRSQLANRDEDEDQEKKRRYSYGGELGLMTVGALFLSLNVAPTEEMVLLSYKITDWHAILLILLSVGIMHGFVYAVSFDGGHELSPDAPWWHALIRFTLPGYTLAAIVSLFTLWIFDQTAGTSAMMIALSVVVLAVPAAIGAAGARLLL